jgi:nucleoside-diphosphate-sugar epimerase
MPTLANPSKTRYFIIRQPGCIGCTTSDAPQSKPYLFRFLINLCDIWALETIPISEDHPQRPINPYGYSKLVVERMLDAARGLRSISLQPVLLFRWY